MLCNPGSSLPYCAVVCCTGLLYCAATQHLGGILLRRGTKNKQNQHFSFATQQNSRHLLRRGTNYYLRGTGYETRVCVDGKAYKGITNYGARPTFDNTEVLTETYLDGFDGDLYGKHLKVEFVRFLRGIQKFDGVDGLKAQLQADIRTVRNDD